MKKNILCKELMGLCQFVLRSISKRSNNFYNCLGISALRRFQWMDQPHLNGFSRKSFQLFLSSSILKYIYGVQQSGKSDPTLLHVGLSFLSVILESSCAHHNSYFVILILNKNLREASSSTRVLQLQLLTFNSLLSNL